jgi:hypothetical protein
VDHFFEALAARLNMVSITRAESSELSAAIGMLGRFPPPKAATIATSMGVRTGAEVDAMTMTTDLKVACYDDFAAKQWALNSAVECHPHTVEVVGSNPTAPTISFLGLAGTSPREPNPQLNPQSSSHWIISDAISNSFRNVPCAARVSSPSPWV